MTITTTRLALPIMLGDDFPYRKEFFEKLQTIRNPTSVVVGHFLTAWLTPEETLVQMLGVFSDYCRVQDMWECYGEDNFDENPAVDFENDEWVTAVEKYLARSSSLHNTVPDFWPQLVLRCRPGDVTADGREVAK